MLNPISYPTGKCFMDKVPEIVLETGRDGLVIVRLQRLTGGISDIFVGRYVSDPSGRIAVDVTDIVRDYLKTEMPYDNGDFHQPGFEAHFIFKANEDYGGRNFASDFFVVNASPDTSLSLEDYCSSHFLTQQPIQKQTNYESPEWLTYYDYEGDWIVAARFYMKAGGATDAELRRDEKPGCWSVNVSYARIMPLAGVLPAQLKGYYDVMLFDGGGNELCRQRYIYDERTGKEHYYLFANPLGGIDTLIALGENVLQPELEHNIGRFAKLYKSLDDTEDLQKWQQNTGMLKYRWRNWLFGLIANKQGAAKYDPKDETYHNIVVVSSDINMSDKGQLANSQFGYIMESAANGIVEEERYLSQSAADSASELDDLTTEAVVTLVEGASGPIVITSEKVFVSFAASAPTAIYYYINGIESGSFTPGTDASPVVIKLPYGASIHFETESSIDILTLNWYEGWKETLTYGFAWSGTVCAELPDRYTFGWSQQVCAQETAPYTFAWKEDRCVLQAGGYEFHWSEDRCVMEYMYKLIWEEMEAPGENEE